MKFTLQILTFVSLTAAFAADAVAAERRPYHAPAAVRIQEQVHREWTFNYFPEQDADRAGIESLAFDDFRWAAVAIRHTWSTYETTGELHPYIRNASEKTLTYWWHGWGWYRKHFSIGREQAGRRVFVEFDGVQKYCKPWLNGRYLGDHKGGFHSFYFDLTDAIRAWCMGDESNKGADSKWAHEEDHGRPETRQRGARRDFQHGAGQRAACPGN